MVCRIKNRHTFKSLPILNSAYFTECRFVIRHITQTDTETETEANFTHRCVDLYLSRYICRDGNLADLAKAGSLHEFLMELHKTFGPIASFWMGQKLTVSIASPELFKEHSHVFDRPC